LIGFDGQEKSDIGLQYQQATCKSEKMCIGRLWKRRKMQNLIANIHF